MSDITAVTGQSSTTSGTTALAGIKTALTNLNTDKQETSGKDATGGYAGLTLFKINFKNALNTFTSFFTNANTVARTYTFQDRDGTIADDTDLGLKANLASPTFTGTVTLPSGQALIAPALGTPASGVMTNVTGLPTTGLVDDAVTLAKMAAGTAGNLVTYDASGNPVAVATGTATHVLTSNGAGLAPTFQAVSGGASGLSLLATGGTPATGNATFTADAGTDYCTSTAHNLHNGHLVVLTTTGTLPAGLSLATSYWVINKTADTFQLSASYFGSAVNITDAGTGTHTWTVDRKTLAVSFTPTKNLQVYIEMLGLSGAIVAQCRFNADTAANYGKSSSLDGAASAVESSVAGFDISGANVGGGNDMFVVLGILNITTNRKKGTMNGYIPGAGAAGGNQFIGGFVWNDTAAQISSINVFSAQAQTFGIASRIYVYGTD